MDMVPTRGIRSVKSQADVICTCLSRPSVEPVVLTKTVHPRSRWRGLNVNRIAGGPWVGRVTSVGGPVTKMLLASFAVSLRCGCDGSEMDVG